MKYIIMCGGNYSTWKEPKQLTKIKGEPIVERTIRLLREHGVDDIYISSNDDRFETFGVPVLKHENSFRVENGNCSGDWVDAFYPMEGPCCYLFGDVVYSPEAIRKIVDRNPTGEVADFFASAPPFSPRYLKPWAEPFAFKVWMSFSFREAIKRTKELKSSGMFRREPIAWELWQVIKGTPLNEIVYTNYTVINDYTCDVDRPKDAAEIERRME